MIQVRLFLRVLLLVLLLLSERRWLTFLLVTVAAKLLHAAKSVCLLLSFSVLSRPFQFNILKISGLLRTWFGGAFIVMIKSKFPV